MDNVLLLDGDNNDNNIEEFDDLSVCKTPGREDLELMNELIDTAMVDDDDKITEMNVRELKINRRVKDLWNNPNFKIPVFLNKK